LISPRHYTLAIRMLGAPQRCELDVPSAATLCLPKLGCAELGGRFFQLYLSFHPRYRHGPVVR